MRGWRQAAAPAATAPQLAHATKNCRRYRQSPDTGLRATESWQCLPSHAPLRRQSRHAVAPAPEGRSRTVAMGCHYRSEEHTSELQSLMRISYAVFCLKKKKKTNHITSRTNN